MFKKLFLLIVLLSIINISNAQLLIKSKKGFYEDTYCWNDGYLSAIQKSYVVTFSKSRVIRFNNKSGDIAWEKEITPKNNWNQIIAGEESDYAYYIDYSSVTQKEKATITKGKANKSKNIFEGYRVNKKGKFKKFRIPYKGNFDKYWGDKKKDISVEYIGSNENGLIGVLSKSSNYPDWTKEFVLFTITDSFKVETVKLKNTLSNSEWVKRSKSNLDFVLSPKDFIIIQLENKNNLLEINTTNFNLQDISQSVSSKSKISKSLVLNSSMDKNTRVSGNFKNFSQYSYTKFKKDYVAIIETLGSSLNFHYHNEKLYCVANNRDKTAKVNATKRFIRLVTFEINNFVNNEITKEDLNIYDLEYKKHGNVLSFDYLFYQNDFYYSVIYKNKRVSYKNTTTKKEFDQNERMPLFYHFKDYNKVNSQLNSIKKEVEIHETQNNYFIIEKINPPMLTTVKKLNIMQISK